MYAIDNQKGKEIIGWNNIPLATKQFNKKIKFEINNILERLSLLFNHVKNKSLVTLNPKVMNTKGRKIPPI
tara:strand:- start:85 stop:297 length:213 start_codon:yes stop_codon:yes gene_type:complete